MSEKEKNPHENHRARLKARFHGQGLDHFEDHNVLELLLFFAVPRADTNPLAHRLMERYGTLSRVFDAPAEDLMQVEGIGEHAATLIKLIPSLARRYCESRFQQGGEIPTHESVGTYLVAHFLGKNTESVFAMFYTSSMELVEAVELFSGSLQSAAFSVREVAEHAILKKAAYVILAHNHPGGIPIASAADLDVTRTVRTFLAQMQVTLLDHFIVAEGKYSSLTPEVLKRECEKFRGNSQSF